MRTLWRRHLGVLGVAALLLGPIAGACDESPEAPRTPRPTTPAEPALGPDEAALAPTPWPTEVRSFRASVEAFESVESCVASMRGSVPVEVSELLSDLGYEDALDEICRGLEAAARQDPALCDELISSSVQRRCRTRVATLHGLPDACPAAIGGESGRDPLCLAWASRDASLCDGAPSHLRMRCLAVATHQPASCGVGLAERSPAACRALVERLGDLVNAEAPEERPRAVLELEAELAEDQPLELSGVAHQALARGVFVAAQGCRHRALIRYRPPLHLRGSHNGLTLEILWGDEGEATLGPASELEVGPVGTGYALRGELSLEDHEATPSGALAGSFEATFTRDGVEHPARGRFRTFVRDREPLPERCATE